MQVTAIKCDRCNTTIYSRARYDMRGCRCVEKKIHIDGGVDYAKYSWPQG